MHDAAFGDEQRRSRGVGDSSDLIENVRPKFRREAALIDLVDELGIHRQSTDHGSPIVF
jgi:hypothetical protein